MILRQWSAPIRTADGAVYANYVASTGAGDYARIPGYLGHQILLREIGGGVSRITTLSWWTDLEAIRGFAGADPQRARTIRKTRSTCLSSRKRSNTTRCFPKGSTLPADAARSKTGD